MIEKIIYTILNHVANFPHYLTNKNLIEDDGAIFKNLNGSAFLFLKNFLKISGAKKNTKNMK